MSIIIPLIYIASLLLAVFIPDLYIRRVLQYYKNRLGSFEEIENKEWLFLPRHLGWIERIMCWLIWFLLNQQFVIFLGIWLTLKVFGDYKVWSEKKDQFDAHRSRASVMIFIIGTFLSIIPVIVIGFLTKLLVGYLG